ncbi:MAG TPA: sigma-70 family RNA polymerase sigma factor [Acidobacteriota bacterium]
MPRDTDVAIVEAVLRGDPDAFGSLVDKYQRPIFNLALRITGNREDAMDATQDAFIKAYQNLGRFDPSRRFFSWFYRIAVHEALDLVRPRLVAEELPAEVAAPGPLPDARAESRERAASIQQALLRLSLSHRVVIVLRHFLDLSYDEMGEILELPQKTVKSRLFAARQQLRGVLVELGLGGLR